MELEVKKIAVAMIMTLSMISIIGWSEDTNVIEIVATCLIIVFCVKFLIKNSNGSKGF